MACLVIKNLPDDATDENLQDFIANAGFQASRVRVDEFKRFAFVELEPRADPHRAIAMLRACKFQERRLSVTKAHPWQVDFSPKRSLPSLCEAS